MSEEKKKADDREDEVLDIMGELTGIAFGLAGVVRRIRPVEHLAELADVPKDLLALADRAAEARDRIERVTWPTDYRGVPWDQKRKTDEREDEQWIKEQEARKMSPEQLREAHALLVSMTHLTLDGLNEPRPYCETDGTVPPTDTP